MCYGRGVARWWGLAFAAAALLGALLAARVIARPEHVLRVGLPGPLGSAHPLRRRGTAAVAEALAYPGLVRCVEGHGPELGLASRWTPSPDGLSADVELRDDVRFHDGRPVGPEDVMASLRALPEAHARVWGGDRVADVAATGPRSLRVRFRQRVADVPSLFEFGVVPAAGDREPGAGPFRFTVETDRAAVLERTGPSGRGYPRIELHAVDSTDELWKRLLAGQLDLAVTLPARSYDALARYPWIRRWAWLSKRGVVLRWAPQAPLRRAVELAIDRGRLIREDATRAAWPGPSLRADPAAARALLDTSVPPVLTLGVPEGFAQIDETVRRLEDDLRAIGVELRTRSVASAEIGVRFAGEAAHVTLAERLHPRPDDTPLYAFVIYAAASASVCGLRESACSAVAFLDSAYPCEPGVASR